MTGITRSHLLAVVVGNVQSVGQSFEATRTAYKGAEQMFRTRVADPLGSGHPWSGVGVPDATTVVETNAIALATMRILVEAAWLAMDGFATAMYNAQGMLRKQLSGWESTHGPVEEDGTVPEAHFQPDSFGTYPIDDVTRGMAVAVERGAKGALAFATIADQSCSGVLDRLWRLLPNTTDHADPATLAHNRSKLAGALASRNLALLTRNFWESAKPKPMPGDEERTGNIIHDVVDVGACAVGVVAGLAAMGTGVGAVSGAIGVATSGATLGTNVKDLVKDAKGPADNGDSTYKPVPPKRGDELVTDAYEKGRTALPDDVHKGGGQGYTPDPSTPGAMPRYDRDGSEIPYKQFPDIGARWNSGEQVVVDERTGHMYYSDDGRSFVQIT